MCFVHLYAGVTFPIDRIGQKATFPCTMGRFIEINSVFAFGPLFCLQVISCFHKINLDFFSEENG